MNTESESTGIHPFPELGRHESFRENYANYHELSRQYREDSLYRERLDAGDVEDTLAALAITLPTDVQARIVCNTDATYHFVLPPDPNTMLADEDLMMVAGGKSAGSAGTVGSASSLGCSSSPSSVSTLGSAGSAGSAS